MKTRKNKVVETVTVVTETQVMPVDEKVYTLDDVLQGMKDMFNAFTFAGVDPVIFIMLVKEITSGINADPAFAKQVFTPYNVQKAFELKARIENKTFKVSDLEDAFPEYMNSIPFWSQVKAMSGLFMK